MAHPTDDQALLAALAPAILEAAAEAELGFEIFLTQESGAQCVHVSDTMAKLAGGCSGDSLGAELHFEPELRLGDFPRAADAQLMTGEGAGVPVRTAWAPWVASERSGWVRSSVSRAREVAAEAALVAAEGRFRELADGISRQQTDGESCPVELLHADRLAAIGTLAAGVAHEINNPLAYVLLNLQYLLRELAKPDGARARSEKLTERLGEARHGAARVAAIVRDLRDYARPVQSVGVATDVSQVLDSALKVASFHLEGRARLLLHREPTAVVIGHPARLEQVFLNLIINAVDALPQSSAEDNEIRVSLRQDGPTQVLVEVSDNGAGIPAEVVGRVFDPFFTTKPAGLGTGLGLPISHSIVTAMGGEITVISEPGKGTTFAVRLPAHSELTDESETVSAGRSGVRKARVLVVDDELPVAHLLSRSLGEIHQVEMTTSGREALDLILGPAPFDVVLCDLLMPGLSGMDLYQELCRRSPGTERILVFMTGGAFTARASEFLARVPNLRIEKPFPLGQVLELVDQVIASHSARASVRPNVAP